MHCKHTGLMLMYSGGVHLVNGVHLQVHPSFNHFNHDFLQDCRFPSGVIRPSASSSTGLTRDPFRLLRPATEGEGTSTLKI